MEIKEGRSSIADAAPSRRTSAKPGDGAHLAPKLRDSEASPSRILWSEIGARGDGGGISAGGTRSPSRLAGGSGAPWLDWASPNAAPARRRSAIASESSKGWRARGGAPSAPPLNSSRATRRTREDVSPENMNGTIDGSRPERRRLSSFDQRKCSAGDGVFFATAPRPRFASAAARLLFGANPFAKSHSARRPVRLGRRTRRASGGGARNANSNSAPLETAPCARQKDSSSVSNLADFADACALCLLSTRRHGPPTHDERHDLQLMPINAQSRHANCPRGAGPRAIRMTT